MGFQGPAHVPARDMSLADRRLTRFVLSSMTGGSIGPGGYGEGVLAGVTPTPTEILKKPPTEKIKKSKKTKKALTLVSYHVIIIPRGDAMSINEIITAIMNSCGVTQEHWMPTVGT